MTPFPLVPRHFFGLLRFRLFRLGYNRCSFLYLDGTCLYKNQSAEECKILKLQLDATLQKRVTRCRRIKIMPSNIQRVWLLKMLKDTRTTSNLALGHLLKNNVHKKPAADLNMATIESVLQRMFVTKKGVLALHQRHHKLLRTPKVPRQQAVKSVLAVFKAHHTKEKTRLLLHAKYPDALAFRSCPRFQPGFKTKRITTSE